ncbi:MAG: hypothetical protein KME27_10790 [Lyngbya sp. HA4199-MV5]|jgi:DNA polymerase III gamma/tau subunit|nr:hypothetical protein [Lyngbya sp. HA4199-MV5]
MSVNFTIEFDAQAEGYQAEDIEQLLKQISKSAACLSTVVILKNAHYLTTKAFSLLHDYLQKHSTRVLMVLISSDRSRIFPPLLALVVETPL